VTAAACGACHSPSLITGKKLDADAWAQMVDQMIGRGAPVEDKDYDTIVDYLARNYGPGKS
jgi:(2Fe-2S) ferredoxin